MRQYTERIALVYWTLVQCKKLIGTLFETSRVIGPRRRVRKQFVSCSSRPWVRVSLEKIGKVYWGFPDCRLRIFLDLAKLILLPTDSRAGPGARHLTISILKCRSVVIFLAPSGTIGLFEDFFSQANRLRRDFYQLVVGDPFDPLFQPHLPVR